MRVLPAKMDGYRLAMVLLLWKERQVKTWTLPPIFGWSIIAMKHDRKAEPLPPGVAEQFGEAGVIAMKACRQMGSQQ